MKRTYDESNNIFIYYLRSVTSSLGDTFGSIFRDNERALVIKEIMTVDPTFRLEKFLKETREYIIPEILEASLKGDLLTLKPWLGEGVFNILKAQTDIAKHGGFLFEGKILDLRNVDIHTAKQLDDIPVLVITFQTQQIRCVRDMKGKVVEGDADKVEHMFYVWALAKMAENSADKEITNGWKLIEMAARDANAGF